MKHVCAFLGAFAGAALFSAFNDATWLRWVGSAVGALVGYQLAAFLSHCQSQDSSFMKTLITGFGQFVMIVGLVLAFVCGFKRGDFVGSIAISVTALVFGYFCARTALLHRTWIESRAGGIFMILVAQTIGWSVACSLVYLVGLGIGRIFA